jgi:hypothetical protein
MGMVDGQGFDAKGSHAAGDVLPRLFGKCEFAELHLDGNFPSTRRREKQFGISVLERRARCTESLRIGEHPQEDMGIEEELHSALEVVQDLVGQRLVEIVRNDQATAINPQGTWLVWTGPHEAGRWLTAPGDEHLLTSRDFIQQPRQVGLGLVDPNGLSHKTKPSGRSLPGTRRA